MRKLALTATACGLAALLVGCGGGGLSIGGYNPVDSDYVMGAGVPTGSSISPFTDIQCLGPHTIPIQVDVEFAAQANNPDGPGVPGSTFFDRFAVRFYDVTYRNLTTGLQVDAPAPMRIHVPFVAEEVPFTTTLTGEWEVLLATQKITPPLSSGRIPFGGWDLEATVTVWGSPEDDPNDFISASFIYVFNVFDSGIPGSPNC